MDVKRRVVVTGIGIISPLGLNTEQTWRAILEGKSGIRKIEHPEIKEMPSSFAGTIENFELGNFKTRHLNRMDPFVQYGLKAAQEAIKDAHLEKDSACDKDRVGVNIGSGLGGFALLEKQHNNLLKAHQKGHSPFRNISPFFIPGTIINIVSGLCSMEYGFKGPNFSVVSACATGAHSIALGARSIAVKDADIMVVGGAEMGSALLSVAGFSACRALSKYENDPQKASRPWDQKRDGFVLADGATVLVLEEYQHALKRGVKIYGEVVGIGMSADAYSMTAPEPEGLGAKMAMENALRDANLDPCNIDYINAHATSTPLGDIAETKAIKSLWGTDVNKVKISSTKSMTGHLLGAAGALEAAFCLLSMQDQIVPPTINLDIPDADCAQLNLVAHHAQKASVQATLSNSFGFGGTNASLIFKKL